MQPLCFLLNEPRRICHKLYLTFIGPVASRTLSCTAIEEKLVDAPYLRSSTRNALKDDAKRRPLCKRKKGLKIGPVENGIAAQVVNGSVLLVEFFFKKAIFLCYFEAVKLRNIDILHAYSCKQQSGDAWQISIELNLALHVRKKKTLVIFILRC